jgi:hypothetical protein
MVPGGDHLPADTPYEPCDFDAVSGVLRAPLVAEQPSWRLIDILNFEAGEIRKLGNVSTRGYSGQSTVLAAAALERRGLTVGTEIAIAPAASDLQVVMGQPTSIVVRPARATWTTWA